MFNVELVNTNKPPTFLSPQRPQGLQHFDAHPVSRLPHLSRTPGPCDSCQRRGRSWRSAGLVPTGGGRNDRSLGGGGGKQSGDQQRWICCRGWQMVHFSISFYDFPVSSGMIGVMNPKGSIDPVFTMGICSGCTLVAD